MEYEIHNQTQTRQLSFSQTHFVYRGENITLATTIPDGLVMTERPTLPSELSTKDRLKSILESSPVTINIDLNELRCIAPDTYFQYQVQYSHLDEMIQSVKLYDTWLENRADLDSKNINELFVLV